MAESTFSPGFRLSALDVVTLIVGTVAATAFAAVDRWMGVAIGFVVAHFFLFCNVLRMSRPLELMWAVVFSLLAIGSIQKLIPWPWTFGISTAMTVIVAIIETRRPSYHGVCWKRLNPELPEWWERRRQRK